LFLNIRIKKNGQYVFNTPLQDNVRPAAEVVLNATPTVGGTLTVDNN
jgi:hypothetical protein